MKIGSINEFTTLNNGIRMPWLGFGVFQAQEGQEVIDAVKWALEAGYRSIDTAEVYGNETGVGKAIRESGVPREDIFLTTKVSNNSHRLRRIREAFNESLQRLKVDYVDLYLIHWPVKDFYQDTWRELEKIYLDGRAKAIGVSNFLMHHLKGIFEISDRIPAVNQLEFHPHLIQSELIAFCKEKKIQVEAYSPLIKGKAVRLPQVIELAEKYQKTPAQIVLRWDLQHAVVTIPKSVHKDRIIANARLFDFELSKDDMAALDTLDIGQRVGFDPDNVYF
jgi:diketogulonate reductase-like aldo/keto reductase